MCDEDLDIDFAAVCRCCLLPNDALVSLTAKTIVEGYLLALPDVVAATVGVQLTIDDQRPGKICTPCKTQLIAYHSFKAKCSRINTILSTADPNDLDVDQDTCCRICLGTHEKLANLKSKTIVDGNLQALPALITECVAFEVNENDQFSQKICASCKTQLVNFFTFREKFRRSEVTLDSVFSEKLSNEAENTVVEPTPVKDEESSSTLEINGDESEEELMTIDELEVDDIKNLEVEEDNQLVELLVEEVKPEENEHFTDDAFSDEPEIEEQEGLLKPNAPTSSNAVAATGKCTKCQKGFYGPNRDKNHAEYHEAVDLVADFMEFFTCRHCSYVHVDAESFELHHKKFHPDIPLEPYEKPTNTKEDLQFLEDDLTASGEFKCGVCNARFSLIVDIKTHLLVRHTEVLACSMCGISYTSLMRLASHMTLKHLNTEFQCRHCQSLEFKSYFDFKNHLKSSCPARKFLCTHCNKYFLTSKSLAAHLAVAETKKYKCHCGKVFRQNGELTIHERVHTGEKNFPCSICGKSYRTSSMRADHMDTHIVGKTFECTYCHIMLQTRTVLRNHLRRHTMGKTHCCQLCPKEFHTKYQFKKHVENIHEKKEKPSLKTSFED